MCLAAGTVDNWGLERTRTSSPSQSCILSLRAYKSWPLLQADCTRWRSLLLGRYVRYAGARLTVRHTQTIAM